MLDRRRLRTSNRCSRWTACAHWRGRPAPTLDDSSSSCARATSCPSQGATAQERPRCCGSSAVLDRTRSRPVRLGGMALGTRRRAYQRQIGLLTPGDRGLYARVTVARHLDLWARLALLDPEARVAADRLGLRALRSRRDRRPARRPALDGTTPTGSLGPRFLHAPRLVLLDEPATSLDIEALGLVRRCGRRARAARGHVPSPSCPRGPTRGSTSDVALVLRDGRLERA